MKNSWKSVFLVLAIVYFISPIDIAPGFLIDDFVALALALGPFFAEKTKA